MQQTNVIYKSQARLKNYKDTLWGIILGYIFGSAVMFPMAIFSIVIAFILLSADLLNIIFGITLSIYITGTLVALILYIFTKLPAYLAGKKVLDCSVTKTTINCKQVKYITHHYRGKIAKSIIGIVLIDKNDKKYYCVFVTRIACSKNNKNIIKKAVLGEVDIEIFIKSQVIVKIQSLPKIVFKKDRYDKLYADD